MTVASKDVVKEVLTAAAERSDHEAMRNEDHAEQLRHDLAIAEVAAKRARADAAEIRKALDA